MKGITAIAWCKAFDRVPPDDRDDVGAGLPDDEDPGNAGLVTDSEVCEAGAGCEEVDNIEAVPVEEADTDNGL